MSEDVSHLITVYFELNHVHLIYYHTRDHINPANAARILLSSKAI